MNPSWVHPKTSQKFTPTDHPGDVGKARILLDQRREIEDAHEVQQEGAPQGGPKAPITSALSAAQT